jgi:hypothetical protein
MSTTWCGHAHQRGHAEHRDAIGAGDIVKPAGRIRSEETGERANRIDEPDPRRGSGIAEIALRAYDRRNTRCVPACAADPVDPSRQAPRHRAARPRYGSCTQVNIVRARLHVLFLESSGNPEDIREASGPSH